MSRGPQGEEDESASTTKAVIFAALDDICLWDCLYALSYDNRQVTLVIHVVSIYWIDAAGTCALIWYRQEDQNLCRLGKSCFGAGAGTGAVVAAAASFLTRTFFTLGHFWLQHCLISGNFLVKVSELNFTDMAPER